MFNEIWVNEALHKVWERPGRHPLNQRKEICDNQMISPSEKRAVIGTLQSHLLTSPAAPPLSGEDRQGASAASSCPSECLRACENTVTHTSAVGDVALQIKGAPDGRGAVVPPNTCALLRFRPTWDVWTLASIKNHACIPLSAMLRNTG